MHHALLHKIATLHNTYIHSVAQMCVSPSRADLNETRCTLEFGQRALKIKNTAYINMEVSLV